MLTQGWSRHRSFNIPYSAKCKAGNWLGDGFRCMWLGQKLQARFAAPGMPPVHRPSTLSCTGYTSTLCAFCIVFMLEALTKEISESLGGLFHPMNFSSQLLPV